MFYLSNRCELLLRRHIAASLQPTFSLDPHSHVLCLVKIERSCVMCLHSAKGLCLCGYRLIPAFSECFNRTTFMHSLIDILLESSVWPLICIFSTGSLIRLVVCWRLKVMRAIRWGMINEARAGSQKLLQANQHIIIKHVVSVLLSDFTCLSHHCVFRVTVRVKRRINLYYC